MVEGLRRVTGWLNLGLGSGLLTFISVVDAVADALVPGEASVAATVIAQHQAGHVLLQIITSDGGVELPYERFPQVTFGQTGCKHHKKSEDQQRCQVLHHPSGSWRNSWN